METSQTPPRSPVSTKATTSENMPEDPNFQHENPSSNPTGEDFTTSISSAVSVRDKKDVPSRVEQSAIQSEGDFPDLEPQPPFHSHWHDHPASGHPDFGTSMPQTIDSDAHSKMEEDHRKLGKELATAAARIEVLEAEKKSLEDSMSLARHLNNLEDLRHKHQAEKKSREAEHAKDITELKRHRIGQVNSENTISNQRAQISKFEATIEDLKKNLEISTSKSQTLLTDMAERQAKESALQAMVESLGQLKAVDDKTIEGLRNDLEAEHDQRSNVTRGQDQRISKVEKERNAALLSLGAAQAELKQVKSLEAREKTLLWMETVCVLVFVILYSIWLLI
jgi:hypothetical protein